MNALATLPLTNVRDAPHEKAQVSPSGFGPNRLTSPCPATQHLKIRRVDLARTILELAAWGSRPQTFDWFERPTDASLERAEQLLRMLGALAENGAITPHGHRLLELPLNPRLAQIVVCADDDTRRAACTVATLLNERDIVARDQHGGTWTIDAPSEDSDVLLRLDLVNQFEKTAMREENARQLGIGLASTKHVIRCRNQIHPNRSPSRTAPSTETDRRLRRLLFRAFSDRVCKRRTASGSDGRMVGGRGVRVHPESVVRDAPLFVAVVVDDRSQNASTKLASSIEHEWLDVRTEVVTTFCATEGRVLSHVRDCYRDLVLRERSTRPDAAEAKALLSEHLAHGPKPLLVHLSHSDRDKLATFWSRLSSAATWCSDAGLPKPVSLWKLALPGLCDTKVALADFTGGQLVEHLTNYLDHKQRCLLDRISPHMIDVPSGRKVSLTYHEDARPPILAVKLQEVFGLQQTPTVAKGRVPVLLHLLAPNKRPVQITQDLNSFWKTTYHDVRKELRQRYPKHPWPEDPTEATATARTKRRKKPSSK